MYTPKKLYWEEKFSTGDDSIDFQHKYMFETFNKLSDTIAQNENPESIRAILDRLRFYADWHFSKEEERMEQHHCPLAQTNKNAHEAFREMFNAYHENFIQTGGSLELAIKIHENLADWFTQHILVVDVSLHACTHKKA